MKKILTIALTLCLLVTALAGCGSSAPAAPDPTAAPTEAPAEATAEPAAEGGKLIVGFDAEFPPFGFIAADGTYDGFDLAMAKELCARLGWEYEAVAIDWNSKDAELSSGTINCIWNGFTMNGREDDYTWSDPYVDNSQVMVVSENSGINSLSDLAGKTVGVQAASAALDLLQSEEEGGQKELADTFAALQQFPDYNNAFVELQAGSIDAVAMDIGVAKYQLESRGEGYKILDEHLNSEKYAIGFKKGNTELCDKVNEGLQQVLADGTFGKLAEKYGIADMVCLEKKGE